MGMNIIRGLPHPDEIKAEHPLSQELIKVRDEREAEIKKVFTGESDKFLLIKFFGCGGICHNYLLIALRMLFFSPLLSTAFTVRKQQPFLRQVPRSRR
jgi:hypothetical protein